MLEIQESPSHLIAMKLTGEFTADDVVTANKAIDEALKDNERISFFAEFDDSVQLTFEGLVKDFLDGIGRIGQMKRFYRAAVATDRAWLAAIARIEGLVFSSMDVRVFNIEDRNKAFAWAAEKPEPLPKAEPPVDAIHLLQTTNDAVFAYEVNGRITEKDVENTVKEVDAAFKRHDKINVLVRMKNYSGFDLTAMLNDDLVRVKFKSLSKVEKYAVIGAKTWMRNLLELVDPLLATNIRVFDLEDEQAAWDWVGASQALLAEG